MRHGPALLAVFLAAACAQSEEGSAGREQAVDPAPPAARATESQPDPAPSPGVLTLGAAGFGPFAVGQPVAQVGPSLREAERIGEDCRLFSDPGLPGVWVMTDGAGTIQRVSVAGPSTIETAEGIAVGATDAAVRSSYPALRREPHEYTVGGANLYTAPSGRAGLRFEMDGDGRVSEMSGGAPPFLGYAEGCA